MSDPGRVTVQWLELGTLWTDDIAWHAHEMNETLKDMLDEPRLGPNRDDFDRIMAPVRRKQRLVAHIHELMPGKRPGRFVREWSCTAEDHPAQFYCRECGLRACCCRCVFCARCCGAV